MAPPTGLEPVTPWLTVRCSTDWAKEEYVELVQFQAPFFVGFYWDCSRVIRSTSSTDWAKEEYVELAQFQAPFFVGFYQDYSRVIRPISTTDWAKEEYEAKGKLIQFPFQRCRLWAIFPGRLQPSIFTTAALNFRVRYGNGWTHCVKITDSDSICWQNPYSFVSTLSYLPGSSPTKYFHHCSA